MRRYDNYKKKKTRKKLRKGLIFPIFALIILSLVLVYYFVSCSPENMPAVDDKSIPEEQVPAAEYREALLVACGDIMTHGPQLTGAYNPQTDEYDFSPSFEFIADYIRNADLAVGNFENTLAGKDRNYTADWTGGFNAPEELAYNLKDVGFDLMCTANNHTLDRHESGIYRTLDILEEAGIKTFGTARTQEERDTPLIVDVNGINVAFLAYTDSTNGLPIPGGRDYMVNYINLDTDSELTKAAAIFDNDISRARKAGADLVAVYMHWGLEYQFTQNDWQSRMAQLLAEAGADLVLGSHPHVIQPMEYITVQNEDGSYHKTFVAYSMGNFISNQYHWAGGTEEVKYGLVLQLHLEKEMVSGEAYVKDVDYFITWVNRNWRHRILPVHEVIDSTPEAYNIPVAKYNRLQPVWNKTAERLEGFQPAFKPQKTETP